MKNLFFIIAVLCFINAPSAFSQTNRDCPSNQVPRWVFQGEIYPSAESICRAALPIAGRPTFRFDSTAPSYDNDGELALGVRTCLYSSSTAQSPGSPPLALGWATQGCRFPTLEEDDNQNENLGADCNNTPYPCNRATGNKFRSEVDFDHSLFGFVRYYNSHAPNGSAPPLGNRWSHSFYSRVLRTQEQSFRATLVNAKGNTESFRFSNFVETNFENGFQNPDNDYRLESSTETEYFYRVINPSGGESQYHVDGRIAFSKDTNGNRTTYDYEELDNQFYLTTVTNHYGHSISFDYELVREQSDEVPVVFSYRRINKVTDQFGAVYLYGYDALNNLTSVVYPDTTPDDNSDNPRKIYHYENQDYPSHLTGISDENGDRYANFAYGEDGKAILSELGITTNNVGQEKIELDFE